MMKVLFFVLYTNLFFFVCGQGVHLEWENQFVNSGSYTYSNSVAIDQNSNVYITGIFSDTIDFDPGSGVYNLVPSDLSFNIFVAKYSKEGDFIWVKTFRKISFGNISGNSLSVDVDGNIIVTGSFSGTVDFDPGGGLLNITGVDLGDIYIVKLDPNGNMIWTKTIGSEDNEDSNFITTDILGNIYITGTFNGIVDFDPGISVSNLSSISSNRDYYTAKYDKNGNFVWAKNFGGINSQNNKPFSIAVDSDFNVYTAGKFNSSVDFDPGTNIYNLNAISGGDAFISKLDSSGNFVWVKSFTSNNVNIISSLKIDSEDNVVFSGHFGSNVDLDPGPNVVNPQFVGPYGLVLAKLNSSGDFIWGKGLLNGIVDGSKIAIDSNDNVYILNYFNETRDFDFGSNTYYLTASGVDISILKVDKNANFIWANKYNTSDFDVARDLAINETGDIFVTGEANISSYPLIEINSLLLLKYKSSLVYGSFFNDLNQNCIKDSFENEIPGIPFVVNPGANVVLDRNNETWFIDSLDSGSYSIVFDTLSGWYPTCQQFYNFEISNSNIPTNVSEIGLINSLPCVKPTVSISCPFIRRCFPNQKIFVKSCNDYLASGLLINAYTEVKLDNNMTYEGSSINGVDMGNNTFRFFHGDIYPGQCVDFTIDAQVSCDAVLGQTLCMEANLYPADSCTYDTIRAPQPIDFVACQLPWDKSSLSVRGWCQNDSIYFTVTNNGAFGNGDMDCYSPVRLYIDGQYMWLDSVKIFGGETRIFAFSGDGRTWRLEADQHPLHPGNSHPNAHVERCGNNQNWTPNLVNIMPPNDADPIIDIYCGIVTGSFDPNDKTGYPLGVGSSHLIQPNGELDYLIRFQNTGSDTAFTVVIRDTLDMDLNIFSVRAGTSSHPYSFRMYGPRVLEWTFNNILLPDSTTNEIESHGFATFTVNQNQNLVDSTEITNNVGIYFDFNDPVLTNTTSHKIGRGINDIHSPVNQNLYLSACDSVQYQSYTYHQPGTYYQLSNNLDTITILNVTIQKSNANISEIICGSYTAPDGAIYTQSGSYVAIIPNSNGCDSTITINLTVNNPTNSNLTETVCNTYTAPDNQIYTQSGTYIVVIPNSIGCDSTITINLTVNNSTFSSITKTVCNTYTAPDNQVYNQSGNYTAIIPNSNGCDSTITINLTVNTVISDITNQSPELISTVDNAYYQWIDCSNGNQAIFGEVNQSFTANDNGEYAVIVTQNSCSDTSECVQVTGLGGLSEFSKFDVILFPNPTSGLIEVNLGKVYPEILFKVITLSAQLVETKNLVNSNSFQLDLSSLANGMYYLELNLEGKTQVLKLVKE